MDEFGAYRRHRLNLSKKEVALMQFIQIKTEKMSQLQLLDLVLL